MLSKTTRRSTIYLHLTVPILLLAYGLRLLDITRRSLWFDEAIEYLTAVTPLHQLPQAIIASNFQPPLHSFLLHAWLQISIQPLWLRYLAILISLFTLVGVMKLAVLIFGTRGALIAGLITAVMPTEIYYAQDVGEYSLLVCTLTWSLYFLYRAMQQRSRWLYWGLWALFSVAAVYTHYGAAIIVIPLALATLVENLWWRRRKALQQQITVSLVSGVLALPILLYFLPAQFRRVSDNVLADGIRPLTQEARLFLQGMSNTFLYNLIGWPVSEIPKTVGLIFLIAIGLLALLAIRAESKRIYGWFIIVYTIYFFLVRAGLYEGFGFRYGLIFTPLFILITTNVIELFWQHRLKGIAIILLGLIVALELYALPNPTMAQLMRQTTTWSPLEQMEDAFTYWNDNRQPDEATFVYYGAVPAFRYYMRVYGLDTLPYSHPQSFIQCRETRDEICQKYNLYFSPWVRQLSTEEKIENMREIMGGSPQKVWLIFSHVNGEEELEIMARLQQQYTLADSFVQGNGSAYLLVMPSN